MGTTLTAINAGGGFEFQIVVAIEIVVGVAASAMAVKRKAIIVARIKITRIEIHLRFPRSALRVGETSREREETPLAFV